METDHYVQIQNFKSFFRTSKPDYKDKDFPSDAIILAFLYASKGNNYKAAEMLVKYYKLINK